MGTPQQAASSGDSPHTFLYKLFQINVISAICINIWSSPVAKTHIKVRIIDTTRLLTPTKLQYSQKWKGLRMSFSMPINNFNHLSIFLHFLRAFNSISSSPTQVEDPSKIISSLLKPNDTFNLPFFLKVAQIRYQTSYYR